MPVAENAALLDGLTSAEVAQRRAQGLANDVPTRPAARSREIVRANVFTPFNFLLGVTARRHPGGRPVRTTPSSASC